MNLLADNAIIKAVSWTLIHSLWLGLATAFLAGLILLVTKKAAPAIRYNLLAGLSISFLLAVGFIFYSEYETQPSVFHVNHPIKETTVQTSHMVSVSPAVLKEEGSAPFSGISDFISDYGSWIVLVWFAVFLFKFIRMSGELRHVYRARNYQTVSPPELWVKRVSELQLSLRIKRSVQLLESKLVTVPSVTGFFKPIILMSIGLLNNIPQEQVEAILLHELAHIRRSDYAINLVQSVMEILFFFNPGILWVSSLLKDERENCCDDLAISVTNNKKEFVNALISFQEYNMNAQPFALQFGDRKMKLADRAKRILFNTNKALNVREKYFLSFGVGACVILFLVVLNVNSSTAQEFKSTAQELLISENYNPEDIPEGTSIRYVDDSKKKKSFVYVFKKDGVLYQVPQNLENFKVDGKLITGKDRGQYLPQIKQMIRTYESAVDSGNSESYVSIDDPETDISEEERIIDEASRIIDIHSAIIDKHTALIDKHVAVIDEQVKIIDTELNKKDGEIDWKKHDKAQRRIEEEQLKIQAESEKIDFESRKIDEQARKIDEQSRKIAEKLKQQEKMIQSMDPPIDENITETVINELKAAGYTGKINSFELSEKALVINGKKQPESLFEKVKKYIKPGMRILYNYESH